MPGQVGLVPGDPTEIGGYRLLGRLAEGGQGIVFLGLDAHGGNVAVKLIRPDWLVDQAGRDRVAKEVAAARRVAQFCTAQVIDARLDGDAPYIVSEYVDGPNLARYVHTNGPLAGVALDRLAIGTATALVAIHQAHVVHRDFKPGNVVLGPGGPRVIDFGIARDLRADTTVNGRVFGTPAYMAPEQLSSAAVGPPADLFAWASTMVFAATGRNPFEADTTAALLQEVLNGPPNLTGVPESIVDVLDRCLAKDPELRPTAQQVLLRLLGEPLPVVLANAPLAATLQVDTLPAETLAKAAQTAAPPRWRGAIRLPAVAQTLARTVVGPGLARVRRNGRATWWTAAGVAVAILALVIGIIATRPGGDAESVAGSPSGTGIGGSAEPGRGSDGTSAAGPSASASTASAAADPFEGRWTGIALQPLSKLGTNVSWQVVITLGPGGATGQFDAPSIQCGGALTAVGAATRTELHLHQVTTFDPRGSCAPAAELTLILNATGGMEMLWYESGFPANTATASLVRAEAPHVGS